MKHVNQVMWAMMLYPLLSIKPLPAAEMEFEIRDKAGKPVLDAVISLYDNTSSTTEAKFDIMQKGKQFAPRVSVVQTGTWINFPNQDKVRHHVYSFSPAKKFEIKLYSGVPTQPILFDKPGLVTLGCNIHDNMLAYVQVVETPYFAKTDEKGWAKLNIKPGKYTLKIWHYALQGNLSEDGTVQAFEVKGDAKTSININIDSNKLL